MEKVYTKRNLENLEDRYEFLFPVPYKTNTVPDKLRDIRKASVEVINSQLIMDDFSLIVCIPHLPVVKVLKQAEILGENSSFMLLRMRSQNYNAGIEYFLTENSTSLIFFWIKDFQKLQFELPKTSHERVKLLNMNQNEIYSFWLEDQECTVTIWN